MQKDESWKPASISTFELTKDSPYLNGSLSISTSQKTYNDKLKNGYEEGLQKAEQELNEYKNSLMEVMGCFLQPLKDIDENIIKSIANLALLISKQIIRRELQINSDQVISVVREAIKVLPLDRSQLIIHLNPNNINIVRKVFNQDDITENYTLVEDPSIEPGGCKIATENSIIDATIEAQVAQIASSIFGCQRLLDQADD